MQLERWEKALVSFTRVIALEPEDPETWANIASIYIRQKRKFDAHRALKESLRISYDNWKIWENYLYVSMDIADFGEVIRAMKRILDLKKSVDVEILGILVRWLLENRRDVHDEQASKHFPALKTLIEDIKKVITNDPELWKIFSNFEEKTGSKKESVELLQKAYRASQVYGWESDEKLFLNVSQCTKDLVEAYIQQGGDKNIHSATLVLKNFLKRTQEYFQDHTSHKQLSEILKNIESSSN